MFMCSVCREAFFLTTSARDKHQTVCLALSNFYTPPLPFATRVESSSPSTTSSTSITGEPHAGGSVSHGASPSPSSMVIAGRSSSSSSTSQSPAMVVSNSSSSKKQLKRKSSSEPSTLARKLQKLHHTKSTSPGSSSTATPVQPSTSTATSAPVTPGIPASVGNTNNNNNDEPTLTWELKKALHSARDYVIKNTDGRFTDLTSFVEAALETVKQILTSEMDISRSFKYNMVLEARYEHPEEGLIDTRNFKTRSRMVFAETDDLDSQLHSDGVKLLQEEEETDAQKSGWIFLSVKCLTLRVSKFSYKVPSGSNHVPLPPKLAKRNACVNVINSDNKCFMYSMLTKHIPNVKPNFTLTEQSFDDMLDTYYNFEGLQFPVTVNQIKHFENQNPNVSVNVFEYTREKKIAPLRVVDELADHTDLLLLEGKNNVSHYVYIQDFVKLIQKQITKTSHKIVVCKRCSHSNQVRQCKPNAETWLREHLKLCGKHKPTEIKLPSDSNNILQFTQYETQIKIPFMITADFESTLKPVSLDGDEDSDGRTYQKHVANSFCTLMTSTYSADILNKYNISTKPFLYRGKDAGPKFLLHLKEIAEQVNEVLSSNEPMSMTDDDRKRHEEAVECELCHRTFSDLNPDTVKCADHDHVTSKFRYSLCNRCNLRCKPPNFIPVWIHNLSNYDQAFIISNLNVLKGCEVKVIPSNKEKMIAISVKINNVWLRFLDSYRMMAGSLDELVKNLPSDQ